MTAIQQALGFVQDPRSSKLGLTFNGKSVGNGEHVPRADAQSEPQLSLNEAKGRYIVVCLDLDAPFISFPILGPILHWIQPSLERTSASTGSENGTTVELSASGTPYVVDYAGPGPPPGAAPHRYIFLLYEQPEGFDGKKFGQPEAGQQFGMLKRMRFDLDGFVRDARLGEIVSGNWFLSN